MSPWVAQNGGAYSSWAMPGIFLPLPQRGPGDPSVNSHGGFYSLWAMLRFSSLSHGAFLGTRFHLTNLALPVTHLDLISWNSVLENSLEPGSISSQQGAMLAEPRASQRVIVYFDKISFVSRSHNYNGFTKAVLVFLALRT